MIDEHLNGWLYEIKRSADKFPSDALEKDLLLINEILNYIDTFFESIDNADLVVTDSQKEALRKCYEHYR